MCVYNHVMVKSSSGPAVNSCTEKTQPLDSQKMVHIIMDPAVVMSCYAKK